jgi:hypothetical protein
VKDVHYDKHLGVAEVTYEAADSFCRRYHPGKYESFSRVNKPELYPVIIDFESLFGGMEGLSPYKALLDVIKKSCITSAEEKVEIAHFIIYQRLRSHAVMNAAIGVAANKGRQKFESLLELKWALSDTRFMWTKVEPLCLSRWRLFRLDRDTFPLSDSAVCLKPGNLMATLSPRLLLEIDLRVQELGCVHQHRIDSDKLTEFRQRTISNTFREIIFSDPIVLEEWQNDSAFQERVEFVRTMKDYATVFQSNSA